jgi:FixJ family two-component response regulator
MEELCVLAVSACPEDWASLQLVFEEKAWRLHCVHSLAEAVAFVRKHPAVVIVSDPAFSGGDWKQLLAHLIDEGHPSALVVVSRLADERLWSEVLHFGGYDVLQKPFDKEEVIRVIQLAWQHCNEPCSKRRQAAAPPDSFSS